MTTTQITTTNILDIPADHYGDHHADFDHDTIRAEYRGAIQELLPDGVTLTLNGQVFATLDAADEARNLDWDEIAESVDLDEIVQNHDQTGEVTITADHIRELHTAEFSDEAVLVIDEGELHIWPRSTATDHGARVITTATDVHEYCDGDLDDALATQLAADLTADIRNGIR